MAKGAKTWGNLPKRACFEGRFPRFSAACLAVIFALLTAVAAGAAEAPVVDSFTASPASVLPGGTVTLAVDAHDPDCADTCTTGCGQTIRADLTDWSASGGTFLTEDNGVTGSPYAASAEWQAPTAEDTYTITLTLSDSGSFLCGGRQSTTAELDVLVSSDPNLPPVVDSLTALPSLLLPGQASQLLCAASDPDGDPVTYDWQADLGTVTPGSGGTAIYTAPADVVGVATVTCIADDGSATGSDTVQIAVVGAEGEKSLVNQVAAPQRLAADSEGNLFVVDRGAISVINLFSEELVYRVPLADLTSVAVDWNDNLLVGGRLGVGVRSRQGDLLLPLDQGGDPLDVADVAVDRVNQRYAALYRGSGRVRVFDAAGTSVVSFGSTGDAPDQLRSPQGLAAAPGGDWLVADSGHGQIKRFDAAGSLVAAFGELGGGVGEFVQLDDVEIDGGGIIYASDSFQSWVQVFDPDGTPREALGGHGGEVGQLKTPTGLVEVAGINGLADFDRLVVASLNSSSLQVFRRDRDPLAGPPPSADATLSPAALSFADNAVGSVSAPLVASLGNGGTAILGLRGLSVSGPFAATHDCVALDPGTSCPISVTFAPATTGPQTGELKLDTSSGPLVVPLSGQAYLPAGIVLRPPRLGFNDQEIGTISEPQTVIATNVGTVPLSILGIDVSAEYLLSHDCPASLGGGASCTIVVRFAPQNVVQNLLGTVTMTSSAPGSPHLVDMEGQGIPEIPRFSVLAPATPQLEEGDGEGAPPLATFEIVLTPAPTERTSVNYEAVGITAVPGEDFEPTSGLLEFSAGETSRTVTVPILGDEILEPDSETLSLELWGPLQALIEGASSEVTILDDEVCLGPVLLANSGAEIVDGAAPVPGWTESPGGSWSIRSLEPEPHEGLGYLAAAPLLFAELSQEVDLAGFAEAIDGGRQLMDFAARVRTGETDTARVLVEYRNEDRTRLLGRFDSGEISSVDAWQEVTDLRLAPPGTRWVEVRLLGHRLFGEENDAFFDAVSLRTVRAATVKVADVSAYEGDGAPASAILPVRLACPFHQPVVVDLATADGSAVAGEDYLAAVETVVLATGETEAEVAIDLIGDQDDEGHETFFVDVTEVEGPGAVGLTERAVGVILDDDACSLSRPAWAANLDLLPARMVLGNVVYERSQLIDLLQAHPSDDVTLELARQLIIVRLNLLLGTEPSILPTAAAADDYLAAHPPGSTPGGEDRQLGQLLTNLLRSYTVSQACPPLPPRPGLRGPQGRR